MNLLGLLLFALVVVGGNGLSAAVATARTLIRESGWQIHVYYTEPVNGRTWIAIGTPFETKQLCEDIKFAIMIERIQAKVLCVWVGEIWTN